ncbi:hypothetical protein EG829_04220 [bacterium]|nr:hypothetical protein [bacterium]
MKKICLMVSLLALSGCSMFLTEKPFPLEDADPNSVKECRKIGKFPGPEGYRFWGPPAVQSDFKWQSAEKAKQMGATHMYWREDSEAFEGRIVGYAFDCTGVDMPNADENDDGY